MRSVVKYENRILRTTTNKIDGDNKNLFHANDKEIRW